MADVHPGRVPSRGRAALQRRVKRHSAIRALAPECLPSGSNNPPSRELSPRKIAQNETGVPTPCGGNADFSPSVEEGVVHRILPDLDASFVKIVSSICKFRVGRTLLSDSFNVALL